MTYDPYVRPFLPPPVWTVRWTAPLSGETYYTRTYRSKSAATKHARDRMARMNPELLAKTTFEVVELNFFAAKVYEVKLK